MQCEVTAGLMGMLGFLVYNMQWVRNAVTAVLDYPPTTREGAC